MDRENSILYTSLVSTEIESNLDQKTIIETSENEERNEDEIIERRKTRLNTVFF